MLLCGSLFEGYANFLLLPSLPAPARVQAEDEADPGGEARAGGRRVGSRRDRVLQQRGEYAGGNHLRSHRTDMVSR